MAHAQRLFKHLDLRIILVVVSLLAVWWLQAPRLGDEFRVDEDFRTFYWMSKFQDPALFPNDQLRTRHVTIQFPWGDVPVAFYSLGYGLLFYGCSFFVKPIFFNKFLPFILMPITVWYLFKFGESVRNRETGVVLAVGFLLLNLASSSSISIASGLQRSFAATLIIAFIYYLHRDKYVAAAIVILISALIYPPAFVLNAATWGLSALRINWRPRPRLSLVQRGIGYLLIACCLGALVLSPVLFPSLTNLFTDEEPALVGPQEQAVGATSGLHKYIWNNPRYREGSSGQLFVIFPFVGRGGLVDLGEDMINLLILFALGCLIFLVRGRRAFDLPGAIWCMLWASLGVFVLAWATALLTGSFLLYLPSRYTRVGLFLFLFMFVFLNSVAFIKEAPALIRRNPRRLIWLIAGIELLVLGLVFFYPSDRAMISGFNLKWLLALVGLAFGALGVAVVRKAPASTANVYGVGRTFAGRVLGGVAVVFCLSGWAVYAPLLTEVNYLNPPQEERELLRFLETLPKDAILAGTPCALDSVPLFARRQILFSCEQPRRDGIVIREALKAYYTDDRHVLVDFCQAYSIDYLVVDLGTYSREYLTQEKVFWEPYNQELLARIVDQGSFVLADVPGEIKVFQNENFFVVPCDGLESIE